MLLNVDVVVDVGAAAGGGGGCVFFFCGDVKVTKGMQS